MALGTINDMNTIFKQIFLYNELEITESLWQANLKPDSPWKYGLDSSYAWFSDRGLLIQLNQSQDNLANTYGAIFSFILIILNKCSEFIGSLPETWRSSHEESQM